MNKQNIYVTGAEQGSGKSIIMLAMMDMLSGYAGKIGFFRPIINDSENKDELIQLIIGIISIFLMSLCMAVNWKKRSI